MLACLGKLTALVLDFVEQADVLDRDHGLVSKGGCERDLIGCERPHSATHHDNHANRDPFTQKRHPEHGARTYFCVPFLGGKFRIIHYVSHMYNLAFERYPPGDRVAS